MYVEENVTACSVTRETASTLKPNRSPAFLSMCTFPAAFLPKVKFSPTTTSATCRRSTSSSCTYRSGESFMNSGVNGTTRKTSTPSSSASSARRVRVVSWAGWVPGNTTSIG
ncbi:Uncharacterised protein [Mycobacteroides abscessus subsp. massiliense]|nr:Uncharacterised protein [Mycobacteroides abscessus subsp. massiliense]